MGRSSDAVDVFFGQPAPRSGFTVPSKSTEVRNRRLPDPQCPRNHPTPVYEPPQAEFPDRSTVRNVIVPGANDTDPAAVAAPSIAGSPLSSTLSAAPFSSTSPFW